MPNEDMTRRLEAIEKKVDDVYVSAEKTRKYILTTMIITIVVVVLPLFGLLFAIPSFIGTFDQLNSTLQDGY